MPQKTTLKAAGLYTESNQLSSVPEGSFVVGENIVVDRENVVESRRGFNKYGTFGAPGDLANQLLTYKDRILVHYGETLAYNNNPHNNSVLGDFDNFNGTFEELEPGLRIRAIESNKNLYFTSNDGIKKISARTAADFTGAVAFITDAGAPKALDVTGSLNSTTEGFLPPNSEVAYRVIWSHKDRNNNLIAGTPSSRLVMSNSTNTNANIDLEFVIPQNVTSDDFYQVYRSAVFTATGNLTLNDIDPGDELQLVLEDFPSAAQITAGVVTVTELAPEDFRQGGLFLYTNPNAGEGIGQANEPPPKAHDVTMYQSTVFYANTETRARTTIALLGVEDLVSNTSSVTIDNGATPAQTYTFVGEKEITNFDFTAYAAAIPASLNGNYFLLNSASDKRKYYTWYDTTKTSQLIDFTSYTTPIILSELDGKFFVLYTKDVERTYYVWFDSTGSVVDPGTDSANGLTGFAGIRVVTTGFTTTAQIANAVQTTVGVNDVDGDFDITYVPDSSLVTIETESFDDSTRDIIETVGKGFSFTFSTPTNADPANDLITNTDVVGRTGFRVNISRNVSTVVHLADATAASILDQDTALDFEVDYTPAASDLDITNTNNGNTTDATDAAFSSFTGSVVTLGNPTTITQAAHGLSSGMTINITASTTTPSINGTRVVTVLSPSSFTIPVTTTVGGTANWQKGHPIANGFAITVTQQGDGEDTATQDVLLSAAASPAQQIDETARSLVNVINRNPAETVYAFYISGEADLPGQILFEVKDIGINQFSVTANNSATGASFNPALPPVVGAANVVGEAETKPNRIYYAKLQQPEAVPLLNFIDVGPEDKAISRILALRESLFILKQDGVYRLTGIDGNYTVDLFDESTKIIAPDTAVVLNNQIYCLTNQGIVAISDTGVSIISAQIESDIQLLASANYDYRLTSFGVSYETDRAYLLWMPSNTNDTTATFAYRYNTQTNAFTTIELAQTCGLVNPGDDKLYLGPTDENYVERERKLFKRTDYADRDFDLVIPNDSVEGTTLKLSSSVDIDIGDAVVQTQYVTVNEYNQLLSKLDLDPAIGDAETTVFDYSSYVGTIPTALHGKYFIMYSASDATRYAVFYDALGTLLALDPNVFLDIADATQIRVDISSGVTTKAQLAEATKTAIQSATFDFIVTYIGGNEFFQTKTVRNGDTTDASDSAVNGLLNGFSISTTVQGLGDYLSTLEMVAGDNIISKLTDLATKLDADPGITQNDFVAAIGTYSGNGATITLGNPTVITFVGHGLQDGRIVTISASTSTPNINGNHVATRLSANTFSIPVTTTIGGTCDFDANLTTFEEAQGAFNTIVIKLNDDLNVTYQNYLESEGSKEFEVLILGKARNTTDVIMQFSMRFMEGPITVFKGINCLVQYTPETFGDTSMTKQVSESTVIFEDANFSRATVGYRTDLSPGFETIDFTKSGKGDYSFFVWSQHNWGGGFSGVPLRTYVPSQKQRCRYIQLQFEHNSAREHFALYGFSYTFRPISERGYK